MRTIESDMTTAIRLRKGLCKGNTSVVWKGNEFIVSLHGNAIASGIDGKVTQFTLAGWNTATTRSRLNALGVAVSKKAGIPIYKGKAISSSAWIEV